jgi:hypothetical protein
LLLLLLLSLLGFSTATSPSCGDCDQFKLPVYEKKVDDVSH